MNDGFLLFSVLFFVFFSQLCQISVQPPVNGELILRFQQLQSRLATLKIENEEVKLCYEISFVVDSCLVLFGGLED